MSASALLIFAAIWLALFPTYRKRLIARSLDACGLGANFGVVFPGWTSPIEVPFDWYDYLGEINGVSAPEAVKGDISQAGRLLNSLPWLDFVAVNELPSGAERLLRPLAGHMRLRQLALKGAGVTDETLADVAHIPGLNRVVLERAQITDAGLANLASLQWLQILVIRQTPISGDGLAVLRSLPRLSELSLSDTEVGDKQVSELVRCKALVRLSLANTRVTDEGLALLPRCTTLKVIDLSGSQVTESGVDRLRQALPNCDIVWQRK